MKKAPVLIFIFFLTSCISEANPVKSGKAVFYVTSFQNSNITIFVNGSAEAFKITKAIEDSTKLFCNINGAVTTTRKEGKHKYKAVRDVDKFTWEGEFTIVGDSCVKIRLK